MTPLLAYPLLLAPSRIERALARVRAAHLVTPVPNSWQIALGVARMWHRLMYRSDTVGTCHAHPVRHSWRARWLAHRPLRFPFLLAERAIAPWDLSGLVSPPERLVCHLLGAHHDGNQFAYDLEILACHPGMLEAVREAVRAVVERDDARSRWLRDLCVFEGYHESLLAAVERAIAGDFGLSPAEAADPDISFAAYLRWCARQPATPAETWRAWRRGELRLDPEEATC